MQGSSDGNGKRKRIPTTMDHIFYEADDEEFPSQL